MADTSNCKIYPQIILFGDSITEACHQVLMPSLQRDYTRRADIINRGLGGYTSNRGLNLLPHFFPAVPPSPVNPRVRLMTVFFGANDACVPGEAQHIPIDKYIDSLRKILTYKGLELHDTKVVLITPPPIDEWQRENRGRTSANARKYAAACRNLGEEMGVPVLDLWTIFMTKAGWKEGDPNPIPGSDEAPQSEILRRLLSDGLHFTVSGYQLVYEELTTLIKVKTPSLVPEKLPWIFPDWKPLLGVPASVPADG